MISFEGKVSTEIIGNSIVIRVPQIAITDPIADTIPRGAGAEIATISYKINSGSEVVVPVKTVSPSSSSFWRPHPYKGSVKAFEVFLPKEEGTITLNFKTSTNAAGNSATARIRVNVMKTVIPGNSSGNSGSGANAALVTNIFIPADITPSVSDSITYYCGISAPNNDSYDFAKTILRQCPKINGPPPSL